MDAVLHVVQLNADPAELDRVIHEAAKRLPRALRHASQTTLDEIPDDILATIVRRYNAYQITMDSIHDIMELSEEDDEEYD